MLKIQGDKNTTIVYQRRERFLTPLFMRAFAIALTVHLVAFLAVRLEQERLPTASWIYPYVDVKADIAQEDYPIETGLGHRGGGTAQDIPPRSEPTMPRFHHYQPLVPIAAELPSAATLGKYDPSIHTLQRPKTELLTYTIEPVITPAGLLAERSFQLVGKAAPPFEEEVYAHYRVTVDDRSGDILGVEFVEGSKLPILRQLLQQVRFAPQKNQGITTGGLALHYRRKGRLKP